MFLLLDTEKRSGIRVHSASYAGSIQHGFRSSLLGCIALGKGYAFDGKQKLLTSSKVATREMEELVEHRDFTLEIVGWFHECAN